MTKETRERPVRPIWWLLSERVPPRWCRRSRPRQPWSRRQCVGGRWTARQEARCLQGRPRRRCRVGPPPRRQSAEPASLPAGAPSRRSLRDTDGDHLAAASQPVRATCPPSGDRRRCGKTSSGSLDCTTSDDWRPGLIVGRCGDPHMSWNVSLGTSFNNNYYYYYYYLLLILVIIQQLVSHSHYQKDFLFGRVVKYSLKLLKQFIFGGCLSFLFSNKQNIFLKISTCMNFKKKFHNNRPNWKKNWLQFWSKIVKIKLVIRVRN